MVVAADVICSEPVVIERPAVEVSPPLVSPPVIVDVAPEVVTLRVPPVTVRPLDDDRPAAWIPELNVEVAPVPPTLITPRCEEEALVVSIVNTEVEALFKTLRALVELI